MDLGEQIFLTMKSKILPWTIGIIGIFFITIAIYISICVYNYLKN